MLRKCLKIAVSLFFLALIAGPSCAYAQEGKKASSVYGTVVQDHVNVRSPSIESTLRKELERAGILVEKNLSIAQASAGVDKFALVGEKVVFDGSFSSVPAKSKNVSFHWDFGDGSSDEGLRVVHIYNRAGNYRVKLTITVDGNVSQDEVVVSVYEKQVVLISDSSLSSEDLFDLNSKIRAEKTDLKTIREGRNMPSSFMTAGFLARELNKEYEALSKAEYIFSYDVLGLMALSRFKQQSNLDFDNTTIVLINPHDEVLAFQERFVQLLYNQIEPDKIIIVPFDFSYLNLLISDNGDWFVIDSKDSGPGLLSYLSFVFAAFSALLTLGFSLQLIYFLLAMVMVSVLCLVAKRIIGFNSVDIFMSTMAILSVLYIGPLPGILMLIAFIVLSFLIHSAFYVRQLVALPWNLTKYLGISVMLIIGLYLVHLAYPMLVLAEIFFPLLVLAFVSDVLVYKMMNKTITAVLMELFQEALLIVLVVFFASLSVVWQMILGYPELYIFTLILVGIFVERYSGLRLSELSEFRSLLSRND